MSLNLAERKVIELGHSIDQRVPLEERIVFYRALANTTSSIALAKHFFECADDLAAAEQRIGQLILNLGKN